ncbi:helix-turn-helix domain-containing protein [Capnocytophaga sp. ARDL2]|uniref:helix-turn-helix domain-containing protein n=1 Tax=Capnocytophaga sp. ARDL2 TaxID=3238809 RepID=UPI003556AD8F
MTQFSDRLHKIFETFQLTSSQFAELIGIQKSTVSHLLSNRNKPSLELLLKIIEHYPTLNLYWLADGSQTMFLNEKINENLSENLNLNNIQNTAHFEEKNDNFESEISSKKQTFFQEKNHQHEEDFLKEITEEKQEENFQHITSLPILNNDVLPTKNVSPKKIESIVYFFSDGTFKRYVENL